ncbi:Spo0E family sporulation regulatory protein-aspartic acid phosphatase [Lysinibacillus sp. NPDC097287]|uniref:Spo0E family sporulation regulatory protein-aspartic acid phosphatase n=1 Tax=Lysinibacillus sp. NPDC097287 TaxID=3364144 RepID=UPI0038075F1E
MKRILNIKILKLVIEYKRQVMYRKAKNLGYSHPKVINCSQELDALLNMYLKQVS